MYDIEKENMSKVAVKTSFYSILRILVDKTGGIVFTIILARLLLPELFGIYGIILSLIMIPSAFIMVGTDIAAMKYISSYLAEKNLKKAAFLFRYFLKLKLSLALFFIIIIILFSNLISNKIYHEPLIFYPLIFSTIFIFASSLRGYFTAVLLATKDLKKLPVSEVIFQTSKIFFSILVILALVSPEAKLSGVFLAAAIAAVLSSLYLAFILIKKNKFLISKSDQKIKKPERNKLLSYVFFINLASVSLAIFGAVDTLMLGAFVSPENIGYYRASFGLALSLSALISFSNIFLPIFSQIKTERLNRGFNKTLQYLVIFSIPTLFGGILLSKHIIFFIYGTNYLPATSSLYILIFFVFLTPLIDLYSTLFKAKEKAKTLSKIILIALAINIFLNYIFLKNLDSFGPLYILMGVGASTIFSRFLLLSLLLFKTENKFRIKLSYLIKPIFASSIMVAFLLPINYYLDMSLLLGALEILLGMGIYFSVMFWIKGITKEDIKLLRYIRGK